MYSTLLALATATAMPAAALASGETAAPVSIALAAPTATPNATRRYCFVDMVTGSRIARRECQTLDKWLARGVDPRVVK